jgi:hypothetical protein
MRVGSRCQCKTNGSVTVFDYCTGPKAAAWHGMTEPRRQVLPVLLEKRELPAGMACLLGTYSHGYITVDNGPGPGV